VDLLAIGDGNLRPPGRTRHRARRGRQILDYGCWVTALTHEQVIDLASAEQQGPFEAAFKGVFGASARRARTELELTIVATDECRLSRSYSPARDFGDTINIVFFSYAKTRIALPCARSG